MKAMLAMIALPMMAQTPLPDGAGKDVIVRVCTTCHGSELFSRGKRDREHWRRTVDGMEGRGAKGSAEDFKTVVDYLMANFGITEEDKRQAEKVNVNKAAGWRIARALKLFPDEGDAVVTYREEHGDFKSLDDLAKVLDRGKIEAVKDRIVF
jgi:competence ComEA-like helix-hairpin-helix protein